MRCFVDVYGLHIGKVDGDGSIISFCHDLQSLDNMLEPAIDFPIFVARGRLGKRLQTILYYFALALYPIFQPTPHVLRATCTPEFLPLSVSAGRAGGRRWAARHRQPALLTRRRREG